MSVKNILVVEDENIIALDLKFRLKKMGYGIIAVVPSGEEAIKIANEKKPDLVLMDIVLKGNLDGVEAAEMISKESRIPVIFISSFSDENTLDEARRVSPFGYLIKPFNENELRLKIETIPMRQAI